MFLVLNFWWSYFFFYKFLHDTCLSIPGVITTEVKPLNLLLEQFVPAGNDGLAGNEQFHQRMEPSWALERLPNRQTCMDMDKWRIGLCMSKVTTANLHHIHYLCLIYTLQSFSVSDNKQKTWICKIY